MERGVSGKVSEWGRGLWGVVSGVCGQWGSVVSGEVWSVGKCGEWVGGEVWRCG